MPLTQLCDATVRIFLYNKILHSIVKSREEYSNVFREYKMNISGSVLCLIFRFGIQGVEFSGPVPKVPVFLFFSRGCARIYGNAKSNWPCVHPTHDECISRKYWGSKNWQEWKKCSRDVCTNGAYSSSFLGSNPDKRREKSFLPPCTVTRHTG